MAIPPAFNKKSGELLSTNGLEFHVSLDPLKCTFWHTIYRPLRVLRPEIFTRARDWPSLASAHPKWGWRPPKRIYSWKLKILPKIERVRLNNFRASGSILTGLFSLDAPDKVGTIFTMPAAEKFVTAKNRPQFFAIFDNFRLWSRISPERINISKIGKALDHLQPLPR